MRIWTGEKKNEGENTDTIILNLATKIQVLLKVEDSSRSHRMGRPGTGKHRAIICRLMKSRPALKDSKVFVSDDLTRARSHLYYLASQKQVQTRPEGQQGVCQRRPDTGITGHTYITW